MRCAYAVSVMGQKAHSTLKLRTEAKYQVKSFLRKSYPVVGVMVTLEFYMNA